MRWWPLAFAPAASAGITDDAQTALNIIPSGQYGDLTPPPGADTQAKMYDGLTPLFDNVKDKDLTKYFKSEKFGIDTSGPGTAETVPYPGVTITRDKYDVPHVNATTHDGGVWAAGWIAVEDRGLLLWSRPQRRLRGRDRRSRARRRQPDRAASRPSRRASRRSTRSTSSARCF